MPIYEFETEAGEVVELVYSRDEVPSIGDEIVVDGVRLRRVVSQVTTRDPSEQQNYRLTSVAAPGLGDVLAQERAHRARPDRVPAPVRAPAYDHNGDAVFRSPKELREFAAKSGTYRIANPKEVRQEHARGLAEKRAMEDRAIKERERRAGHRAVE